jgi:hypothetical protein
MNIRKLHIIGAIVIVRFIARIARRKMIERFSKLDLVSVISRNVYQSNIRYIRRNEMAPFCNRHLQCNLPDLK